MVDVVSNGRGWRKSMPSEWPTETLQTEVQFNAPSLGRLSFILIDNHPERQLILSVSASRSLQVFLTLILSVWISSFVRTPSQSFSPLPGHPICPDISPSVSFLASPQGVVCAANPADGGRESMKG